MAAEPQAALPTGIQDGFLKMIDLLQVEMSEFVGAAINEAAVTGVVPDGLQEELAERLLKWLTAALPEENEALTRVYSREINAHFGFMKSQGVSRLVKTPPPEIFTESLRAMISVIENVYLTAVAAVTEAAGVSRSLTG